VLRRSTKFGAGSRYEDDRPGREVLDDPAWEATPFLKGLKDTGRAQLGTSWSGNHLVGRGILEALGEVEEDDEGASVPGRRCLTLLSHCPLRTVK
jgi:tRNA-splicing ligase RtcB (3'-phosphate/5'-hydroxy nucleic acid ligase)